MNSALPLLHIDDASVAEARRALLADALFVPAIDDALLVRLLLAARALPLALDALAADAEVFVRSTLGPPHIDAPEATRGMALLGAADLSPDRLWVEVRVAENPHATDPLRGALVSLDAAVLCRVKFPVVTLSVAPDAAAAGKGGAGMDVHIQRFASSEIRRTGGEK